MLVPINKKEMRLHDRTPSKWYMHFSSTVPAPPERSPVKIISPHQAPNY